MQANDSFKRSFSLEQVLTEKNIHLIVQHATGCSSYELICSEVRPATEGLCGFLADHIRAVLHVKVGNIVEKLYLFVKRMPVDNQAKAAFISENEFFKREVMMFQLIDELKGAEGPNPWCAKSYVYTESLLVMPDLATAGYKVHPLMETLDLPHVLTAAASIARFHAAFANYETKKTAMRPYNFYKENEDLLTEPVFKDSLWLRAAAKLTADLLDAFSSKYNKATVSGLESKIRLQYLNACASLDIAENSLNVCLHKDPWNNNILFKYEGDVPTNAILCDYQCARYGPPAFDVTALLYLCTSRSFREQHERQVFKHYFEIFLQSLEGETKIRLYLLGYDEKEFMSRCEKSRMFAAFVSCAIFPNVLMEAKEADRIFNNPDTYATIMEKDRSGPIVEYARTSSTYKERLLEISEEFVERYVLNYL